MKKLLIIQAGGTIDKHYPETAIHHGYNFEIGEAAAAKILNRINIHPSWQVVTACMKDSLNMDDNDRTAIRLRIAEHDHEAIVITHGTDTMDVTARSLSGKFPSRTIVLVGARQPEVLKDSDADFNLGFAIAFAQIQSPGVYTTGYGAWRRH